MPDRAGTPQPACDGECGEYVRKYLREHGVDAHVTHIAPLVPSPYENLAMTCSHGVTWHTAPTSEWIAKAAAEGIA